MPYITEERRMIQEQAREFTLNEVLPVANKLDPEKGDIPMSLRDKMAELGYFGILIPEQYGGLGLGCFEYCLVTEELSRGWMSVASLIARGNLLIGSHMMSEEQRGRYLPRMAKGEFLGAFSMSEPNAGSDISNISCRARKDGTGYLISGNKYWCTFADGADYIMLVARTSDAPDPKRKHVGLSSFLIEKPRGTLPKGVKLPESAAKLSFQLGPGQSRILLFDLNAATRSTTGKFDAFLQAMVDGTNFGLIIAMCAVGLSLIYSTDKSPAKHSPEKTAPRR